MNKTNNALQQELYGNHPKHHVAIDNVILGYHEGKLMLLLYPRSFEPAKGNWSLLGGFLQDDESSDDAASRILKRTTGLSDIYMEQVTVFSNPKRETDVRVVCIMYYALIRLEQYDENITPEYGAEWFPIGEHPELIFDHEEMVQKALESVRMKASASLLGQHLLSNLFTIFQLRRLYEAIFQKKIDPGNFRKKILSLKVLKRHDKKDITESKKGAHYYEYIGSEKESEDIIGQIIKI